MKVIISHVNIYFEMLVYIAVACLKKLFYDRTILLYAIFLLKTFASNHYNFKLIVSLANK